MEAIISSPASEQAATSAVRPSLDDRRAERIERLARRLAVAIADSADADQVAIWINGINSPDRAVLEELIPHQWLTKLNGGKPATYRIAILLRTGGHNVGTLHLATLRPSGFQPDELARAQMDAYHASEMLATALGEIDRNRSELSADGVLDIDDFRPREAAYPALESLAG